jgi:hypothetical protein
VSGKKRILIIVLLCSSVFANAQEFLSTYCTVYPENCKRAHAFTDEHHDVFDSIVKQHNYPATFLMAIVAPEVSRYNEVSDQAQTMALEMFYTQMGTDYANFSIGYFQMKPSFVEEMEAYAKADSVLKTQYKAVLQFNAEAEGAIRSERIQRLKELKWQVNYLCLFYAIMEQKYGKTSFNSVADKLWFYAAAYNSGFNKNKEKIEKWEKIAWFPNGDSGPENFIYSFVAYEFYYRFNN